MALPFPQETNRNRTGRPKIAIRRGSSPRFCLGALVEVASAMEGFVGSYYEAEVGVHLTDKNGYVVEYCTLVKDDWSGPLREEVSAAEVRPRPPMVMATKFQLNNVVDAFDNDRWWVGKIISKVKDKYYVWFETTGDLIAYPKDRLRVHQDWIHGRWI